MWDAFGIARTSKTSKFEIERSRFSKVAQAARKLAPGTVLTSTWSSYWSPGGILTRFVLLKASISVSIFLARTDYSPRWDPTKKKSAALGRISGALAKRQNLEKNFVKVLRNRNFHDIVQTGAVRKDDLLRRMVSLGRFHP